MPTKCHIFRDSAYPDTICRYILNQLITLFRDNGHLTLEKNFDFDHSPIRVGIERTFRLLKDKFRKLKFLDGKKIEEIPKTIVTCNTQPYYVD